MTAEAYGKFLKGTKLLTMADAKKVMIDKDGFGSLYGSSRNADAFNVRNNVYKTAQDVKSYIDPSITNSAK